MRSLSYQLFRSFLFAIGGLALIAGCDYTNYQRIDEHFRFGYTDRSDYTNVECEEVGVIPGGCDEAKWAGDIIVARGLRQYHPYELMPKAQTIKDSMVYFIIHKTAYYAQPATRSLSDGFEGPMSETEFFKHDPLPSQAFRNAHF
jgi:hypothetical protein